MLTPQEIATWVTLTQKVVALLDTQSVGVMPPAAPPTPAPVVPMAMPQTPNPVVEAGVHVGRIALWQSAADKKPSYNGNLDIHAQSGDPRNPDARYKVFLYRNTDPTKNFAHQGQITATDAQGNSLGNVGTVRVLHSNGHDPSVVAYCYIDLGNYTVQGPLHRQGGQSSTGSRLPDVVGNLYFNATQAAGPTTPVEVPATPPTPIMAPVTPVAVAPVYQPQAPATPAMPDGAAMQSFFTTPPEPVVATVPSQLFTPPPAPAPTPAPAAPEPQQEQPPAPAPTGLNITQMSPAQLAAFAMQNIHSGM